jgi:hypothetical protein
VTRPPRRSDARIALDSAITAAELAVAAPQVIAARLAMLADPAAENKAEAVLMVTEKAQAFAEAGLAASGRAAQMGLRTAAFMVTEGMSAGGSPVAAADRLFAYWSGMTRLSLQMQAAALAPLHKAATDNARRLKR